MLKPNKRRLIISLSGGACTGKSTVARSLAANYNCKWYDRGTYYRAVAYSLADLLDIDDPAVEVMCRRLGVIEIRVSGDNACVDGVDVSAQIREPTVERLTPKLRRFPVLVIAIVQRFRLAISATDSDVIVTGRNLYKNADISIHLSPSMEQRVKWFRMSHRSLPQTGKWPSPEEYIMWRDHQDLVSTPVGCHVVSESSIQARLSYIAVIVRTHKLSRNEDLSDRI